MAVHLLFSLRSARAARYGKDDAACQRKETCVSYSSKTARCFVRCMVRPHSCHNHSHRIGGNVLQHPMLPGCRQTKRCLFTGFQSRSRVAFWPWCPRRPGHRTWYNYLATKRERDQPSNEQTLTVCQLVKLLGVLCVALSLLTISMYIVFRTRRSVSAFWSGSRSFGSEAQERCLFISLPISFCEWIENIKPHGCRTKPHI